MKFRAVPAVVALLVGAPFAAAATTPLSASLQDLISAGSSGVTIGDKTFYDFSYQGAPAGAADIHVIQAPGSDIGLEFQYNWSSTNRQVVDSLIRYKVHVNDTTPTQQFITSANIHFDGSTNAGNLNLGTNAAVTQTISDLTGNTLGQSSLFSAGPNFAILGQTSSNFAVAPTTRDLMLEDDIAVHSLAGTDTATIGLVDNTFRQLNSGSGSGDTLPGATAVPLPPAVWMVLSTVGLAAVAPFRRRFRGMLGL